MFFSRSNNLAGPRVAMGVEMMTVTQKSFLKAVFFCLVALSLPLHVNASNENLKTSKRQIGVSPPILRFIACDSCAGHDGFD